MLLLFVCKSTNDSTEYKAGKIANNVEKCNSSARIAK